MNQFTNNSTINNNTSQLNNSNKPLNWKSSPFQHIIQQISNVVTLHGSYFRVFTSFLCLLINKLNFMQKLEIKQLEMLF